MFKETPEQTQERKEKICAKCMYHSLLSGYVVCDYIEITKKRRPCPGYLCVEQGVFKPIPNCRKSKYRTWKAPEKEEKKEEKTKTENQLRYEARKEKAKQYYQEHKSEILARTKAYKAAHPEKVAEYNKKRKREKPKLQEA